MNKNRKNANNKYCVDCNVELSVNNTNSYDFLGSKYLCKECSSLRAKKNYIRNIDHTKEQRRNNDWNIKIKVINAYGGKCVCCNEATSEFLTIDHINNDGAIDRKENGNKTGTKLYRWLIKNNFPKDKYQLLCFNCNCSKGFMGYCPHNKPDIIIRATRNNKAN